MSASTVAMCGALAYRHRVLLPILAEHLDDNDGELLPHLFLPDAFRWLAAHVDDQRDRVEEILNWLEAAYATGDDDIRDLIAVSGVEMIPDPGQPGAQLRDLLPPPWLAWTRGTARGDPGPARRGGSLG